MGKKVRAAVALALLPVLLPALVLAVPMLALGALWLRIACDKATRNRLDFEHAVRTALKAAE